MFDFLLCRAAFKNFGQPVRALQEMCRVLKPGGRGLIIDLRHGASQGRKKKQRIVAEATIPARGAEDSAVGRPVRG